MKDLIRHRVTEALGSDYELGEELGRGGMSVVYRALDCKLRRDVAIKILPPEFAFDQGIRERFRREAQMAAQLNHPHIVPIFSVEDREEIAFFSMALCEGESLAVRLARTKRPPLDEVRRILAEVSDALAYAHARGVVHRDIKPDNILIEKHSGRALVTDFGIARAAEGGARLTITGIAVGTPAFMSPEQALGEHELDGRSDLYSLGAVAYQMVAGAPPFTASNTPSMLLKHVSEALVPLSIRRPDVPPRFASIIERALEKSPDSRWQSALEFRSALLQQDVFTDQPDRDVSAASVPPLQQPRPATGAADAFAQRAAAITGRDSPRAQSYPAAPPRDEFGLPLHRVEHRPLSLERELDRDRERESDRKYRLLDRVMKIRRRIVLYAGMGPVVMLLNLMIVAAGGAEVPWFLFFWAVMALDMIRLFGGLWADGYGLRDVFGRRSAVHLYGSGRAEKDEYDSPLRGSRRVPSARYRSANSSPQPGRTARVNEPAYARDSRGQHAPDGARDGRRAADDGSLMHAWQERRRARLAEIQLHLTQVRRRTALFFGGAFGTMMFSVIAAESHGDGAAIAAMIAFAMGAVSLAGGIGNWLSLSRLKKLGISRRRALFTPNRLILRREEQKGSDSDHPVPPHVLAGPFGDHVRAAMEDRILIDEVLAKMDPGDRKLLPDVVPTVKALCDRVYALTPTLHSLDSDIRAESKADLDSRIADLERIGELNPAQERILQLLRRQRETMDDLLQRREVLAAQMESASMLLRNLKLDLLKIGAGGLNSALDDVNSATQEARALSRDIGHVLSAADDLRRV